MTTSKEGNSMWEEYKVEVKFTSRFANSAPQNPKDILAMLEARAATDAHVRKMREEGEEIIPIEQLAEELGIAADATEDVERGHAVFLRDEHGLYYEARCVRAHIKDCANQLQGFMNTKALKAKLANRVYVVPERLYLGRDESDGSELRIIHAMTPKGPRSSLKTIDYLEGANFSCILRVLNDGVISEDMLRTILEYGSQHGMGQERSQDWGRYEFTLEPSTGAQATK